MYKYILTLIVLFFSQVICAQSVYVENQNSIFINGSYEDNNDGKTMLLSSGVGLTGDFDFGLIFKVREKIFDAVAYHIVGDNIEIDTVEASYAYTEFAGFISCIPYKQYRHNRYVSLQMKGTLNRINREEYKTAKLIYDAEFSLYSKINYIYSTKFIPHFTVGFALNNIRNQPNYRYITYGLSFMYKKGNSDYVLTDFCFTNDNRRPNISLSVSYIINLGL